MEAIGAVASIVGIAGFVGQAIGGLQKLYDIVNDCRDASVAAYRFLRDVKSLTEALRTVESFLVRAKSLSNALNGANLASLSINVEDCAKDVVKWVQEAEAMVSNLTKSSSFTKSWFKKFLAAMKKQGLRDITEQMASHKSTIMLSLSATGRLLDVYNCSQSEILVSKVEEASDYGKVTVEALSRLETKIRATESDGHDGNKSDLSSLSSALSRVESRLYALECSRTSTPSSYEEEGNKDVYRSTVPKLDRTLNNVYADELYSPNFKAAFTSVANPVPWPQNDTLSKKLTAANYQHTNAYQVQAPRLSYNTHSDSHARCASRDKPDCNRYDRLKRTRMNDTSRQVRSKHLPPRLESPKMGKQNVVEVLDILEIRKLYSQNLPAVLKEYLELSMSIRSQAVHIGVISTLLDGSNEPNLASLHTTIRENITECNKKLQIHKTHLWNSGYDLEQTDHLLEFQTDNKRPDIISTSVLEDCYQSVGSQSKPWWNVLHHSITQSWITKTDRINSWLLQNLAASPEEASRHKALLPHGEEMEEEQWARLVLKFWPLDDAAPKDELDTCSTNGAIDSAGACHSTRVLLFELPFNVDVDVQMEDDPLPLRRKFGDMSEGKEDGGREVKRMKIKGAIQSC